MVSCRSNKSSLYRLAGGRFVGPSYMSIEYVSTHSYDLKWYVLSRIIAI